MLNKSCSSLALEANRIWIFRILSSHQQRVWSIYIGHKSISCFIFYSVTRCAAEESPLVFCGFQRRIWQRNLLQWREHCSACTPPGEWGLVSANRNFLEPGKVINGTKKKKIKLKPMFTPCHLNCAPVTSSRQNFLIFSLFSILRTQISPSPHHDTGDPTPPWEF